MLKKVLKKIENNLENQGKKSYEAETGSVRKGFVGTPKAPKK